MSTRRNAGGIYVEYSAKRVKPISVLASNPKVIGNSLASNQDFTKKHRSSISPEYKLNFFYKNFRIELPLAFKLMGFE